MITDTDIRIDTIHVMPGLYCNFYCSHCVNDSGPKQTLKVTPSELKYIRESISLYRPKRLQFTGGEPTFYIDEINNIIESHKNINECEVQITTNGWYANSMSEVESNLGKINKIDFILLSYDKYHSSKITPSQVSLLKKYCGMKSIKFCVSMCITTPLEAIEAKKIMNEINVDFLFQKVDATGRAKKNKLKYQYPTFEESVLDGKCPNLGTLSYIPQKGFTVCCSNLIFNSKEVTNFCHENANEHLASDFYESMSNHTFRELLEEKKLDTKSLKANLSSPCALCETIWESKE